MFNSARALRGQSSPSTPIDAVPAERALRPTKARALASRLNDINVCVTSGSRLPRHFGQGALFWRTDNMRLPSALKRVFLPGKDDADSFSKLAEKYDLVAVEAYGRARFDAKSFAQNSDGVAQSNRHISQGRLASVRDQLTKALTHDAKFAEAWVLLARTLRWNDSEISLADKQVPAGFIRSLAAVMADPYDPRLIMQLLSDLPAEENLPEFLKQAEDQGQTLPLTKARLALYILKYLDPGYARALSALIESGEDVQMSQLMPMGGALGATRVSSSELGAIALTGVSWLEGFFSLRVSRDGVSGNDQRFALGGGAYVTPEQLDILTRLETEELDSNTGPAFDRESGEALLDRDRARAELLDQLADTLAGPDSWFYVPDYMLMTKRQLRAMTNVFRAQPGAFDALQRAIDAPVPPKVSPQLAADSSDQSGSDHSQSDDDSLSERSLSERSLGGMSWGDLTDAALAPASAPVDAQMPGPQPLYRNAAINTAWIGAHRELIEGRADPALYRRLAVQAQTTPLGLVTVLGQSYRARGLELRAEVLENNAKPSSERSVVPTFRLYLDQAQELASATLLNPVPIKKRPFVFKLSNQRGYDLVDVLTKEMPHLWGPKTLERDLTAALKTFLRDFNETRSEPFSALSEVTRREDADFKRALAVVDLMAQMPERFQSLRDQYKKVLSQAKKLAGVYDLNLKSLGAALPESGERSVCIQHSQNNGYKVRIFDRENSYTDYSVTEPRLVDIIADRFSGSSDLKEAEFIENLASNLGHTLTEKTGLTIPEEVSNAEFPSIPPYASPPSCFSCLGDEETAENPLLAIPFDAGGHRECMAEKMIVQGWPDLRGAWSESPALAFIQWAEQANQTIEGYSLFVRSNRPPPPPPPPVQSSDSDSGLDSEAGWGSDDDMASVSSGNSVSMSGEQASGQRVPPIPPRAPLVRQPGPPPNPDAIDQWLNARFGGRSQNLEGLGWRSQGAQSGNASASRVESAGEQGSGEDRLSVEWGNGEAGSETDGYIPLPDLEAPSDEMAIDNARAADDDSVSASSSEASGEGAGYRQGTRPIV